MIMETIEDLLYKGTNIKKENNFALGKVRKFCNSYARKNLSLHKINSSLDLIRKENNYNINFINHNRIIILEKIKNIQNYEIIGEKEEIKDNIKRMKNKSIALGNFIEKMSSNRESSNLLLIDLPKSDYFEIYVQKEINFLKDIVFTTTFENFKNYKKYSLEYFEKFKQSEDYAKVPNEKLDLLNKSIDEHIDYLNKIEEIYNSIKLFFDNVISSFANQIDKYKLFLKDIDLFIENLNKCEAKTGVFRKHKNLFLNLNQANIKNYKKLFEDFKNNITDITDLEKININFANDFSNKLKNIKLIISGFGIKSIQNKFNFLDDHYMILNDKAREIKNIIS